RGLGCRRCRDRRQRVAVGVVPAVAARRELDPERRVWREDRLSEHAAEALRTARRDVAGQGVAGCRRWAASPVEVDLVEVALIMAEVATDAERLELEWKTGARPDRRRAPIVARDCGREAGVLADARQRGSRRRGALLLDLAAVPRSNAEHPARI